MEKKSLHAAIKTIAALKTGYLQQNLSREKVVANVLWVYHNWDDLISSGWFQGERSNVNEFQSACDQLDSINPNNITMALSPEIQVTIIGMSQPWATEVWQTCVNLSDREKALIEQVVN